MSSLVKQYAPRCALPGCNNLVGYHKSYPKSDGTWGAKWKTFCEPHRTLKKGARDAFIASRGGCENRDARLGWKCGDPTTDSLTIDHDDGNKYNNDPNNLVVLCANCHNKKSKRFGDTLQRYSNMNERWSNFFDCEE